MATFTLPKSVFKEKMFFQQGSLVSMLFIQLHIEILVQAPGPDKSQSRCRIEDFG